jgi:hypothetical protein
VPVRGETKVRVLSTTERDLLSWSVGNVIYNTTLGALQTYRGTFWSTEGRHPLLDLGFDLVLDARFGVTQSAGAASEWKSIDSNNYALAQATGGSQPTFDAASEAWGGRPCLTFDGSADHFKLASVIPGGATGVVVLVGRHTGTVGTDYFLGSCDEGGTDDSAACGFDGANNYAKNLWNVSASAQLPYGSNDWGSARSLAITWSDGTDNYFRVNGGTTEAASGTDSGRWFGSVSGRDNTTIGCIENGAGASSYFEGDICCIGVKNSATLAADELAYLEVALANEWGLIL